MSYFQDERLLFHPVPPKGDAIPTAFAFPNQYSVGITSLGYQVVWATLASRADVNVGRVFTDVREQLPSPLELVGFSLSWELDYGNVLSILETLHIPIWAHDRKQTHPLVFGGGAVLTANPEPFAPFFDVILLGDGEELLGRLIDTYQCVRGSDRSLQLHELARVPGIYVPSLYGVDYENPVGFIKTIQPLHHSHPSIIEKQTYRGTYLSASTVVTKRAAWDDIYMIEVVRSCPELCRFCLASYLTLPFRPANLEEFLLPAVDRGFAITPRLGLLGASITQHPEFEVLLRHLTHSRYDGMRLTLASVRTNTVTTQLAQTLVKRGTKSLTIAVESGSDRLRHLINKKLTTDEIIQAAENAKAGGLTGLKFYGMVGLPGELPEDIDLTVKMMQMVKKATPGLRLTLGCSTFVPKAHTPFQWFGVNSQAKKRMDQLQKQLRPMGIDFRPESYDWSTIQALISRGDRRLAPLLERVRHYGDSLGSYRRAFKDLRGQLPDMEFYVHDHWSTDQMLPWSHINGSLPLATLVKHQQSSFTDRE